MLNIKITNENSFHVSNLFLNTYFQNKKEMTDFHFDVLSRAFTEGNSISYLLIKNLT